MSITNDFTNIIEKINIINIVSEYIEISKKGRNYWSVCPFHQDNTPSLSISEEKQIFKCFACGAGGNAITFVRDIENINFFTAAQRVCEIAGIESNLKTNNFKVEVVLDPRQIKQLEINDMSLNYFNLYLTSQEGVKAMEYLESRGINEEIINNFDLGLAPNHNELNRFLKSKEITALELVQTGMGVLSNNKAHDFFKERIIFPIKDGAGKAVAFSGRTYIEGDDRAKYQNSPETDVFIKSNVLYNFHNAKKELIRSKELIIVEGFMDVIALYKVGIKNVVATMGTAFTTQHLNILKSFSKNVVLFMDSDKAGQDATIKMSKVLLENHFNVRIVQPKENMDVDDILKVFGEDEVKALVDQAVDFYQFLLTNKLDTIDRNNINQLTEFVNFIKPIIKNEKDHTKIEVFSKVVFDKTGVNLLEKSDKRPPPIANREQEYRSHSSKDYLANNYKPEEIFEYKILKRLITSEDAVALYQSKLGFLFGNTRKILADFIVDYYHKHGEFNHSDFINIIHGKATLEHEFTQVTLIEEVEYNQAEMAGLINKVKEYPQILEIAKLEQQIRELDDAVEKAKLLKEIMQLKRKRGK